MSSDSTQRTPAEHLVTPAKSAPTLRQLITGETQGAEPSPTPDLTPAHQRESVPYLLVTLRSAIRWVVIGCAVLLALPCVFFGLWFAAAASNNSGSPALAAEWRDHLAQFPDPDTARAADP